MVDGFGIGKGDYIYCLINDILLYFFGYMVRVGGLIGGDFCN